MLWSSTCARFRPPLAAPTRAHTRLLSYWYSSVCVFFFFLLAALGVVTFDPFGSVCFENGWGYGLLWRYVCTTLVVCPLDSLFKWGL